jgi:agmatinase
MHIHLILFLSLVPGSSTWEFPHTPTFNYNQKPIPLGSDEDVDIISGSQFNGLRTYANIPYVNCLVDSEAESRKYDIAIIGAPFDTVCCPKYPKSLI